MDLDQVPSLRRNKPVQSNIENLEDLDKIHLIAIILAIENQNFVDVMLKNLHHLNFYWTLHYVTSRLVRIIIFICHFPKKMKVRKVNNDQFSRCHKKFWWHNTIQVMQFWSSYNKLQPYFLFVLLLLFFAILILFFNLKTRLLSYFVPQ